MVSPEIGEDGRKGTDFRRNMSGNGNVMFAIIVVDRRTSSRHPSSLIYCWSTAPFLPAVAGNRLKTSLLLFSSEKPAVLFSC